MSLVLDEFRTLSGAVVKTDSGVKKKIDKLIGNDCSWDKMCCYTVVTAENSPFDLCVVIEKNQGKMPISWMITQETREIITGSVLIEDCEVIATKGNLEQRNIRIDANIPMGYHNIKIQFNGKAPLIGREAKIISTPDKCYLPNSDKIKGLSIQLYSLVSEKNWGIGDFTDLRNLIKQAPIFGLDFIGLNPINLLYLDSPQFANPYRAASRTFINPLYVDISAVYEYETNPNIKKHVKSESFQARIKKAKESNIVNYKLVTELKLEVTRMLFDAFMKKNTAQHNSRGFEFENFCEHHRKDLEKIATYQALSAHFAKKDKRGCSHWPKDYQTPYSKKVKEFVSKNSYEISYYMYLQWIAYEQFQETYNLAKNVGMKVGLYADLPTGSTIGGAEIWENQNDYITDVNVGFPIDKDYKKSENWQISPISPVALKEKQYEPFIKVIRKYMRYAGAIRFDHIMQIKQMYWILKGGKGAMVKYPMDELLGIIALESVRNKCMVVGENVRMLADGLNEKLEQWNILGINAFRYISDFAWDEFTLYKNNPLNLISPGNHNMPTVNGLWSGSNIKEKLELKLINKKEAAMAKTKLVQAKIEIINKLAEKGFWFNDDEDVLNNDNIPPKLCKALYQYIASSPCVMMKVNLEDIIGRYEQINMYRSSGIRSNWRYKADVNIDKLSENEEIVDFFKSL